MGNQCSHATVSRALCISVAHLPQFHGLFTSDGHLSQFHGLSIYRCSLLTISCAFHFMLTGESISLTAKNLKFWEEVSMSTRRNKTEWLGLINQCRKSGLSDKAWCLKNEISYDAFRSAVRALRSSGYEIPDNEFNSKPVLDLTAKGQPVKIAMLTTFDFS